MQSYDVLAQSAAQPDVVWTVLLDPRSWPAWSHIDSLDIGRSSGLSVNNRDGVGAVRAFRIGKVVTTERITGLTPGRRFTYESVENSQMADHGAAVDLLGVLGGGTQIRWHGTYSSRGVTRWFSERQVQRVMQGMATGLADYAAGLSSSPDYRG